MERGNNEPHYTKNMRHLTFESFAWILFKSQEGTKLVSTSEGLKKYLLFRSAQGYCSLSLSLYFIFPLSLPLWIHTSYKLECCPRVHLQLAVCEFYKIGWFSQKGRQTQGVTHSGIFLGKVTFPGFHWEWGLRNILSAGAGRVLSLVDSKQTYRYLFIWYNTCSFALCL